MIVIICFPGGLASTLLPMPSWGLAWDLSPAYLCRNWLFKVIGGRVSNIVGLTLGGGGDLENSIFSDGIPYWVPLSSTVKGLPDLI